MPENQLTKILTGQTEILLKNVLATVQEANLEAELDGINSSRFIFHTLHSLDKWFINPAEYKYDEKSCGGTEENLSVISSSNLLFSAAKGVVIPCKNLKIYANFVTKKIRSYMAIMTDKMLFEKPDGCDFTRLELILGQFRHAMCHAGISSAMNVQKENVWISYFGLD